jgi:DNA repair protein RecO (recombination protein O)
VVLRRRAGSVKTQEVLIFLVSHGVLWVGAPGANGSKNRFGAGIEPMMWGEFELYQSPRRLYLKGVDVREDFWSVRRSRGSLMTAVSWCGELASRLPYGAQCDNLLSLLWGSMKNLAVGLDPLLLDVRFAWRWGNLWGVAPALDICSSCGRDVLPAPDGFVHRSSVGLLCDDCRRQMESDGGVVFWKPLAEASLHEMLSAATLPREKFAAWAASRSEASGGGLKDCSVWLYSFLS